MEVCKVVEEDIAEPSYQRRSSRRRLSSSKTSCQTVQRTVHSEAASNVLTADPMLPPRLIRGKDEAVTYTLWKNVAIINDPYGTRKPIASPPSFNTSAKVRVLPAGSQTITQKDTAVLPVLSLSVKARRDREVNFPLTLVTLVQSLVGGNYLTLLRTFGRVSPTPLDRCDLHLITCSSSFQLPYLGYGKGKGASKPAKAGSAKAASQPCQVR